MGIILKFIIVCAILNATFAFVMQAVEVVAAGEVVWPYCKPGLRNILEDVGLNAEILDDGAYQEIANHVSFVMQ